MKALAPINGMGSFESVLSDTIGKVTNLFIAKETAKLNQSNFNAAPMVQTRFGAAKVIMTDGVRYYALQDGSGRILTEAQLAQASQSSSGTGNNNMLLYGALGIGAILLVTSLSKR